ncbi:type I-E CRISPR-associated protein Cas5/CasD [Hoyosella sp. YIM 151337]|uniref:type I-E CRISPR-associated protein Cas5/CasD n=1 Tax=Hoyosella sp. YIM 151337 TaxID=2992742 RepID=UPI00223626CC|nr:type I-E CRISPR-associated protein Cas5/CasD [Hoyosella sp. YIM 151337]MCW4353528.1 type I-E CRISPR-associated protein Cas5/CasD [Hoyosella sp. YIM 151337]
MTTLIIRLAAPLQAWGAASRYTRRDTRHEPTKSGIIGLLAAAQGCRRTDDISHLAGLRFGVRVDQQGTLIRDFQVARSLDGSKTLPLSYRYYLADAAFIAGVEGGQELISGLSEALINPTFPLYLGRRSCPPSEPLLMEVTDEPLLAALQDQPWRAAEWYQRKQPDRLRLRIVIDSDGDDSAELVRDQPRSFDPRYRSYDWRAVSEHFLDIDNPLGTTGHEPLAALGGV